MKRRGFITLVGGRAVFWPVVARTQQSPNKVWRVGYLFPGSPGRHKHVRAAEAESEILMPDPLRLIGLKPGESY